jgi:hypothetical protein
LFLQLFNSIIMLLNMLNKIQKYQIQIEQIKREIQAVGEMRPGTLTRQTYRRGKYQRPYWQISYTQKMKSKTDYVREECVNQIKRENAEYIRFKKLTARWVELALKISKEKMKQQKTTFPEKN